MKSDISKTKSKLVRELQSLRKRVNALDITKSKQAEAEQFLQKSVREMTVLNTLGQQVSSSLSTDNVVQSALDGIVDLIRPDMVLLFLRDKDKLFIRGEKYTNPKFVLKNTPVHKVGKCLCGVAVGEKRAIYSININHDPRCTWNECKEAGFISFAALPLRSGDEIIGVLGIGSAIERDFSEQATFLETVSNQIAIGLQNAVFYEQLQGHATKLEQEIIERKRVEEELKISEARLRKAQKIGHIGTWDWDPNSGELIWSDEVYQILGFEPDEVVPSYELFLDMIHPDDRDFLYKSVEAAVNEKKPYEVDCRIIRKDGSERVAHAQGEVQFDKNGKPLRIIGLYQDITERKRAEEDIQRHIKELTTIYDAARKLQHLHTPDVLAQELISILEQTPHFEFGAVLLIDESTGALTPFALSDQGRGAGFVEMDKDFVSSQRISVGQGITGWVAQTGQSLRLGDVRSDPRYSALRKDIRSELCVPLRAENRIIGVLNVETTKSDAYTDSDQRVLETIASQMALAIQQSYLHERIERHAGELEQRVHERTTELKIANKELEEKTKTLEKSRKSLALLLEDVNKSRAELDISNKNLEVSNKELEAFSYSVSHDLRAPLRAIDGFTNILMEDYVTKLDEEGKRLGSIIRQNAQQMSQLIDDLLDFSHLGRTSMSFTEIDMQSMANAIYHEATSAKERKRITFTITDLSKIDGDTSMMRQMWMNLISNALKFSARRKQAVISVTCQEEENKLTYCIKDNGAGFNMKYKDKLFDVFQRLHSEKEFKGTGVGLALVWRIIHRHSGEVWAKGEVDHGAAFYFSLPKNRSTKNGS